MPNKVLSRDLAPAWRSAAQRGSRVSISLALALVSLAGVVRAEPDGATLFAQNCAACHQKNGEGIKGAYPALAGDKLAQGSPDVLAKTVLYGRGGMPAFAADLADPTIAKILTYVRSSWGNKAGPISPAVLTHMRVAGAAKKADVIMGAH